MKPTVRVALAALALALVAPSAPTQAGGLLSKWLAPRNEVAIDLRSDADLPALKTTLKLLGWNVTKRAGGSRPLYVSRPGLLGALESTVLKTLSALSIVRKAEDNILYTTERKYGGEQSQLPVLHDDLVSASVTNQPGALLVGLDGQAPAAVAAAPTVAVVDGGFDLGHEAMGRGNVQPGFDARDNDSDPTDVGNGCDDDGDGVADGGLGHGNAVCSMVMLACPGARVVPIRALDDEGNGTTADVAAAIYAALDRGATVLNLSLAAFQRSEITDEALHTAWLRGVLVVAAAGNAGTNPVLFPASSDWVVGVVGTDASATKDPNSNYGSDAALGAPSVDVVAPFPRTTNKYGVWNGTSFASPLVAGAIARTMMTHGTSPAAAAQMLISTTQPYTNVSSTWADAMGTGLLDLRPTSN
jgi:hypothetical protein